MAADPQARLRARYERIQAQLAELFAKNDDPLARMATAVALLHHKNSHFFWTGFYRLVDGDLLVGPYQGPLACAQLERGTGVCWACVERGEPVLVPDVEAFEGHIACDSRSKSEVVVPLRDASGRITGVLDVDAKKRDAFTRTDVEGLTGVVALIHGGRP
jgi:GAF domain-containing protein